MKRQKAREIRKEARSNSRCAPMLDEKIIRLFESDVLAAEEYHEVYHRCMTSSEQELMTAVLEQGIADYRRYVLARDKKGRSLFLDAQAWITTDDHDWVFSFANCCAALGIEPSYLRQRLAQWQQNRSSSKAFCQAA